jgi:TonB family protein
MSSRRRQPAWLVFSAVALVAIAIHAVGLWTANEAYGKRIVTPEMLALFRIVVPPKEPVEVEMAFVELPAMPDLTASDADKQLAKAIEAVKLPRTAPPPPAAKKKVAPPPPPPGKKPPPPMVAMKPVPQPPRPKMPEPAQVAKPPAPKPPPQERHKMVEVDDDKNVVDEETPEAQYFSDKNRRVKKQTYAKDRNLEKTEKGKAPPSAKNPDKTATEPGAKDDKVAQREDSEQSELDAKRQKIASVHDGRKDKAQGIKLGQGGKAGQEGQGGKQGANGNDGSGGENGKAGKLAMRDARGLGVTPGMAIKPGPTGADDDSPRVAEAAKVGGRQGTPGKAGAVGRPGAPGTRGPKLRFDQRDYERIVGEDKADEEVVLAKRKASGKKGKWEKHLERTRTTLETFSGEVAPGNQTELGTRAHPFAVFIARMHNRIHELWGFGFLADLDGKPASNPMNDRSLEVTMEIVINDDGSVDKVTIVKPSGVSAFDISAVDVVENAGPYDAPPAEIRSGNGKVYMHWTFHRDERQCTPYFADPFILDNGGPSREAGVQDGEHGDEVAGTAGEGEQRHPERLHREKGSPTAGAVQVPHVTRDKVSAGQEVQGRPDPADPRADEAAIAWGDAFEKSDLAALVAASALPFSSRGKVVATDAGGLAAVWRAVINEEATTRIAEWKVMSAAGYRLAFGHLPEGVEPDATELFLAVRVGKDTLTVSLTRQSDGSYKATAITR